MGKLAKVIALGAVALVAVVGHQLSNQLIGPDSVRITDHEVVALSDAVKLLRARVWRGSTELGSLVAIYSDPKRAQPRISLNVERKLVRELETDAPVVINGGYFTRERRATGLLISDSRKLSPLVSKGGYAGSGVLLIRDGVVTLHEREKVNKDTLEGTTFAIQAGPRVVEPGGRPGILSDDGLHANRTVIGRDVSGRLVIVAVHAGGTRNVGLTLFELQHVLGQDGLGQIGTEFALDTALNLDGGPSTGIRVRGSVEIDLPERAPVHSVVSVRFPP